MGIEIDRELCTNCGLCASICPEDILTMEPRLTVKYPMECSWCGACQMDCPTGAIQVIYGPGVGPVFLPQKKGRKGDAL